MTVHSIRRPEDLLNRDPYDRVSFRGFHFNARDVAMIFAAERRFGAVVPITQGSFNDSVDGSAGTHDEGGASDWSVAGMSGKQKYRWGRSLKDTGWCTWRRYAIAGLWPEHQHGVARGCHNLSSPVATNQIWQFDDRQDGLVSANYDPSYRPEPKVEFNFGAWKDRLREQNLLQRINHRIALRWREIRAARRKVAALQEMREFVKKHGHKPGKH